MSTLGITKTVSLIQMKENELTSIESNLLQEAVSASHRAYAPHSKFYVGAALILENGEIVTGSNQENAAYPSGICAERVALFKAGSDFPSAKVLVLAIYAHSDNYKVPDVLCPCGGCLQVMSETENRQNKPYDILLKSETSILKAKGVSQFLPFSFSI
jgi:cytidine deaminase